MYGLSIAEWWGVRKSFGWKITEDGIRSIPIHLLLCYNSLNCNSYLFMVREKASEPVNYSEIGRNAPVLPGDREGRPYISQHAAPT